MLLSRLVTSIYRENSRERSITDNIDNAGRATARYAACSKSEFHVAREDTKFARNNLKVNYPVKGEIEQQQQHAVYRWLRGCNVYGEIREMSATNLSKL